MPETYTDHPRLTARFDEALLYATAHHRRQLRKGTTIPYAAHLLAVASIVLEMESPEDEAIAALLHDVVEDGGGMTALREIEERFGADVARIVLANSDSTTGEGDRGPWRRRKEDYVAAIAHKGPDELRVSLADKLHNARSIAMDHRQVGEELWSRFATGNGDDVRWYYRALLEAFTARREDLGDGGLRVLEELGRTVEELG
ncbi:HD domain-containing protein [Patulibacter americanus]|uniref:HD domain-containing protein n=1 Tax=Patulibacter americanus TaxID=588672 RepID=UPI0003B49373|nr:HD domain-containing protein [Patulibacter americanus]